MNPNAILMFAFVAVASAAVHPGFPVGIAPKTIPGHEATAEVLRSESVVDPDKFHYAYETSNGIVAQADGQFKQLAKPEEPAFTHQGSFSYTAPDNTPIKVDYVADENGYQPSGAHLPVSPPIPPQIARALEWIAAHPYTGP